MARRPIVPPRNPGVASGRFSVDAVPLITIGPEHPIWSGAPSSFRTKGAIVRIQPPAHANPEFVETLAKRVFCDAAVVKVHPPAPSERTIVEQTEVSEEASMDARQTVFHMVAEARTKDRDLLVDVVEEALSAAGL